uniref:Uncharacterized protein LOC111111017 isoform X2 n=1 Tax=Crassostrea virginica TaxID=6565 RepID=A0A8B8BJI6_CRAVI|nr:uncharacterized protein LOC111111017 isoform X2 [Crassostrea virginica]
MNKRIAMLRLSLCCFLYAGFFVRDSVAKGSSSTGQDPPPFVNPFNQGNSLFETPYSGSINAMGSGGGGFMNSIMTMSGGGGRNGLPSMFMKDGKIQMGGKKQQCLKNIVCPQYCHEVDENGCETCPCGPANGMLPPGYMDQQEKQKKPEEDKKKTDNQCLQTLICMLSCKEGYELGQKGGDGCQTCKCVQKDGAKDKDKPQQTGQEATKNGTGTQSSGVGTQGSGDGTQTSAGSGVSGSGSGAQGPFGGAAGSESGTGFNPMFPGAGMGSGTGSGSASGAGMPSPFGGGASGGMGMSPFGLAAGGGGTPGRDCFGPECSAKNGMKLFGETKPPVDDCPSTTLCIKTCKQQLKLGPKGTDGCPSCACVKTDTRTTPSPRQEVCDHLLKCMMGCQNGYEIGEADTSGCPSCSCKSTPTTISSPVPKSSCQAIMELCVKNCRYGYQLIPASKVGECASCLCQPEPTPAALTNPAVAVHQTSCQDSVVRCMTDCRYGYFLKASGNGACPRCQCLPPPRKTESVVTVSGRPNVYNVLKNCPEAIHCMINCKTGYALQTVPESSCPQCTCQAASVQTLRCSAALSCRQGCVLGYKNGNNGCPSCSCVVPSEVGLTTHTAIYVTSSIRCNAHFSCSQPCPFGYRSGDNSCPTCQCLVPIKGNMVTTHQSGAHKIPVGQGHMITSSQSGSVPLSHVVTTHQSEGHKVPVGLGHLIISHQPEPAGQISHVTGSHGEVNSFSTISMLVKYCSNVAHCVRNCGGGFSLTGTEAGKCPACTCAGSPQVTGMAVPPVPSVIHSPALHVSGSNTHPDIHTMCPETFRCGEKCDNGFTLKNEPGSNCPTCYCITGVIKGTVSTEGTVPPPIRHPNLPGGHVVVGTGGAVPAGIANGGSVASHVIAPSSPVTVPETVHTAVHPPSQAGVVSIGSEGLPSGPGVHYNILQGPGGAHLAVPDHYQPPAMTAGHAPLPEVNNCVGPACSAKNGLHKNHMMTSSVKQTPPSQCARIIHCVLTCHSGYRLTSKDPQGCPGCDCLPSE